MSSKSIIIILSYTVSKLVRFFETQCSFRKYKAYADIHGGSHGGHQMTVGLSMTAIFGNLLGYFFRNIRNKTSNITWRYATPCRPVIDCKMNDLEGLFHVKIRFRPARLSHAYLCLSSAFLSNIIEMFFNKYESIDRVGFSIWHHTFSTAAVP